VKRAWPLLAIGAVAYLLVLVVDFPAVRLVPLLERQLPGLALHSVSGSVFAGQTEQLVYQGFDLGPLSWRIRPARLLLGHLEYQLAMSSPGTPGHAIISMNLRGDIIGRDIELELLPEPIVNHYSPVPVRTSGEIHVQIDTFELAGSFPDELDGLVSWKSGALLEPVELLLGDVAMQLAMQDDVIVGTIVEGGRLESAGETRLFPDGRYQVNLKIMPNNEMSNETLDALQVVWRMQPDGELVFTANGRI